LQEFPESKINNFLMASPTIKLNNGLEMPQVGFGLWKVENERCADIVYNAIKAGYRLFDGACGSWRLLDLTGHC
jgi:hypothetical protein